MSNQKVIFTNREGHELTARLDLPLDTKPKAYALFAHCFTCSKNLSAVRNISRSLNSEGVAVLKFDFTGLGESQGDFADTNFSSNIEDLCAASEWMAENYEAPQLLIGHSLGGAAVLFAAGMLDNIKAVATIGAPSEPGHVAHLLKDGIEAVKDAGQAEINIGGRPFLIKNQFLEDLDKYDMETFLPKLRKPVLIAHSPQDTTVEIANAAKLYTLAHHPKSFVSLDGADHLLTKSADSKYIGSVIAAWSVRYLDLAEKPELPNAAHVIGRINEGPFETDIKAGKHSLVSDEPESFGGTDFGPTPYELVSSGLAACTAMTMKMYARRKEWPLEEVIVHVNYDKQHQVDCENCEADSAKIDTFEREIIIKGALDEKQRARLMQIADKCPVHKTLHAQVQILTKEKV